jgi:hypothetical protein
MFDNTVLIPQQYWSRISVMLIVLVRAQRGENHVLKRQDVSAQSFRLIAYTRTQVPGIPSAKARSIFQLAKEQEQSSPPIIDVLLSS